MEGRESPSPLLCRGLAMSEKVPHQQWKAGKVLHRCCAEAWPWMRRCPINNGRQGKSFTAAVPRPGHEWEGVPSTMEGRESPSPLLCRGLAMSEKVPHQQWKAGKVLHRCCAEAWPWMRRCPINNGRQGKSFTGAVPRPGHEWEGAPSTMEGWESPSPVLCRGLAMSEKVPHQQWKAGKVLHRCCAEAWPWVRRCPINNGRQGKSFTAAVPRPGHEWEGAPSTMEGRESPSPLLCRGLAMSEKVPHQQWKAGKVLHRCCAEAWPWVRRCPINNGRQGKSFTAAVPRPGHEWEGAPSTMEGRESPSPLLCRGLAMGEKVPHQQWKAGKVLHRCCAEAWPWVRRCPINNGRQGKSFTGAVPRPGHGWEGAQLINSRTSGPESSENWAGKGITVTFLEALRKD